jgi:hypothetical protein
MTMAIIVMIFKLHVREPLMVVIDFSSHRVEAGSSVLVSET